MYSEDSTTILGRMLSNVSNDLDKSEGSLVYDSLSPVSNEVAQQEIYLDEVLNKVFATTAEANGYSSYLELRCGEFGITRKGGTYSTGQVTFTGTNGTNIPINSIVQTESGLQYQTTTLGTISSGSAVVNVQAINIGASYNVPANTIIQIPTVINGISSVTNATPTTSGTDNETDSALLQRLLLQVQTPPTSGNVAQYKQWALSVPGVGACQVFPLWNGNGTVKVCAVDSNMQPLSSTLLTNLQNYIEGQRPIGATVTYETAIAVPINITVNVTKQSTYLQAQIQNSLITALTSYLKNTVYNQGYVSYGYIGSLIMGLPGVLDYNTLLVNGGTSNVTITSEHIATVGTVTVNAS